MEEKRKELVESFTDVLARLGEAVRMPKTDVTRDSAIKRFELTFDIAWKTVKAWLEERGTRCVSPKSCFQDAYREGLIDYEKIWLDLLDTRNKTVHTYIEEEAENVYAKLPAALPAFEKLLAALRKEQ